MVPIWSTAWNYDMFAHSHLIVKPGPNVAANWNWAWPFGQVSHTLSGSPGWVFMHRSVQDFEKHNLLNAMFQFTWRNFPQNPDAGSGVHLHKHHARSFSGRVWPPPCIQWLPWGHSILPFPPNSGLYHPTPWNLTHWTSLFLETSNCRLPITTKKSWRNENNTKGSEAKLSTWSKGQLRSHVSFQTPCLLRHIQSQSALAHRALEDKTETMWHRTCHFLNREELSIGSNIVSPPTETKLPTILPGQGHRPLLCLLDPVF